MTAARAALFASGPFVTGADVSLDESAAHHLRVVRIDEGERLTLRDGLGSTADGVLTRLTKSRAVVTVDHVASVPPPVPVHLLVPIADRERMLWLAEKAEELNIASWRPVLWQRSRSVSPRGEGEAFQAKIRARMVAAMLQSRSAWLPELRPDASPAQALATLPEGPRVVLDAGGRPMVQVGLAATSAVTLAIGPEGGFDPAELVQLQEAGFSLCTLGASILRFETAGVAALAVVRSLLLSHAT